MGLSAPTKIWGCLLLEITGCLCSIKWIGFLSAVPIQVRARGIDGVATAAEVSNHLQIFGIKWCSHFSRIVSLSSLTDQFLLCALLEARNWRPGAYNDHRGAS